MLYHLSLGAAGRRSANAWDWSHNEWGYRLEKLGDGTMGHPVEPFYRDCRGRADPRAAAARSGADVGRAGVLRAPAATATGWQPGPERVHGLHAAARLRERDAGFPARPGRLRRADGPDHRLRVRPDAHGAPGTASTASTSPTTGARRRADDLAGHVAAAVQAALRAAVRPGPRAGAARLVPLLRRVRCRSRRISTRSASTCSTSRSPTWSTSRRSARRCAAGSAS